MLRGGCRFYSGPTGEQHEGGVRYATLHTVVPSFPRCHCLSQHPCSTHEDKQLRTVGSCSKG